MLWVMRKILDRLLAKSVLLAGRGMESILESEARLAALRRAEEIEDSGVAGAAELAARLRAQVMDVEEGGPPCSDVLACLAELEVEDLHRVKTLAHDGDGREGAGCGLELIPAPASRKRGRPRKHAAPGNIEKSRS